ncbi:MAG: helix-turn-helix transcriptional regulator [Elusimicrobia bacterium]|nr:helix-turn-helix transcriptional regulator [Elusimicrobiota bacterium]
MKPAGEFLKGCTETIVLSLLAQRKMYGYELVSEIQERSGGFLRLGEGTIYPLLYTLERKGLVKGAWEGSKEKGRRRKYYALTAKGEEAAQQDRLQWNTLAKGMRLVLGEAA